MKQTGRIRRRIRHLAGWVRRPYIHIIVIVLLLAVAFPHIGIPGAVGIGLLIQTVDLTLRLREACSERPESTTIAVS